MSAHVLLILLNELGKRDKMRGLPSILSLFRNKFNKFNNTRAQMLDSIYHMTLRLFWNLISDVIGVKTGYWSIIYKNVNTFNMEMSNMNTSMQCCYGCHKGSQKSVNH